MCECGLVKVLVVVSTLLIYSVDPDVLKCAPDTLPICAYMRKNNFYWVTLPMCSSYLVVFIVTVYVVKIIIKQENMIVPGTLYVRGGTNEENHNRLRVFTISGRNTNIPPINQEDQEMKIEEETDETPTTNNSSRAKESRKTDLIRRDEANPHLLYIIQKSRS